MAVIDLGALAAPDRIKAVEWCVTQYGPVSDGKWEIDQLTYIKFKDDKKATWFLLNWIR